jgi:TRAP-type transport system periplasmic protein
MKIKVISVLLLVVLCALLILPGCKSSTPTEVIELSYTNFFASTHYNSILAEKWIQEIETRTKGRVNISYYPAAQLASAATTYDAVVNGIADIGMSVLSYTPGRFPASELVDLPHSYPNGWVATNVANDFYNEFKPAEFNDVHPLFFHATGPYVIFTTDTPVRQLSDLNGMIIRATGIGSKIVTALGAQPYGATQGEVSELLSKGVVDGNYSTLESLKSWKQGDVVKYVTNCQAVGNTSMMFVVMNSAKWAALPADIQKIFTDVSEDYINKYGMVWNYGDQGGVDYFMSLDHGREQISLTKAETDTWVSLAVKPLIDTYITEKTAAGLNASEYEAYINERVTYWSARVPSTATIKTFVESEVSNWTATTTTK